MIFVNHYMYAIRPPIPKTIFIKHCRVKIMAFAFVLFHRHCFFNFCCHFCQRFSTAHLLKLFCSTRSIDYIGDLYPASSFSFVRCVLSPITVISSCSRSNHHFREKIKLLLMIVLPLCGSMHVVKPSVVLILVLPTCGGTTLLGF